MNYCFDTEKIDLNELKERLTTTDLVPSRNSLLNGLDENLEQLTKIGLKTMGSLLKGLKNNVQLFSVADQTGIDREYLALLRRELESYLPKPFPLKDFTWISAEALEKLEAAGIRNTAQLYENSSAARSCGVDPSLMDQIIHCADLTRIQWINPTAARMLQDAGYDSPADVAAADANVLCETLMKNNQGGHYFKGNIGLRDINRLVHAARYTARWG
ncbi:MAG: DUF4332 domain-containing protein [Leptolinea sp.]|nr:DUF4332 domain-containing protein [Leptolinea sp.]